MGTRHPCSPRRLGIFRCPAGASAIIRQRYHPEVYLRQHLQVYDEVLSAWKR
jgi:hypothetical protein